MRGSRDAVPVTSEGPLVSRCLGVSLSATTGISVTAGNCAGVELVGLAVAPGLVRPRAVP